MLLETTVKTQLYERRVRSTARSKGLRKRIETVGTAEVYFGFRDENETHPLVFHLLSGCIHNVILVKERFMDGILQHNLLYLGDSAPRFEGRINGIGQDALTDSGENTLVMKTTLRVLVYLSVLAATYDVEWEFGRGGTGGQRYQLDLHILKNTLANIILNGTFLFGTGAYSNYNRYLADDEGEDEDAFFFALDFDPGHHSQASLDMSSILNPEAIELLHLGGAEDRIAKFSKLDLPTAWAEENGPQVRANVLQAQL
ncbi:uncharacterized protein BDR25DRAFT_357989 [Lindgomyces ingoldianus]|uniref:Uncharacterized protein n=1 Tax=Lindgomyces ingoldianus TaxID=673940 RepID=A0ACB6QQ24_9PLEO|nr:uncharacterized protein BDR25DRAFT_357989 [Lindgomyces ingoldianus]KAF2468261.1 hypothetical protein BDR25DRAFT_357989 [Lindgomyces ingoldianus]